MVVGGGAISVVLLGAVFYQIDWSLFLAALRGVHLAELGLAGVVIVVAILARGWRWRLLYGRDGRLRAHFHSACIGYLGNVIYPAKAGELLRVFALARAESAPISRAMVSALSDRLNDVFVLLLMLIALVAIHGDRVLGQAARIGAGLAFVVFVVFSVVVISRGKGLKTMLLWLSERIPSKTREWVSRARSDVAEIVDRLHHPRMLGQLFAANLAAILADYTAIWLAVHACGLDLPYSAALTVGVFLAAGQSLPSSPGYVGIYQVAVVLALRLYDVPQENALAASLVLHLATIVTFAILGVWAMSALGSGILRRRVDDPGVL